MVHVNPADTTRRGLVTEDDDERRTGDERRSVSRRGERTVEFEAGQYIFREDEEADSAFIIKSGRIEITRAKNGGESVMAILKPGEMFGEMALIDDLPRMASARACDGPVTLYVISRDELNMQLASSPRFIQNLLKVLSSHARSAGEINQ